MPPLIPYFYGLGSGSLAIRSPCQLKIHKFQGDHLRPFSAAFAKFFANNTLPKLKGAGFLDASTKKTYFKAYKGAIFSLFPTRLLLLPDDNKIPWWSDLTARFIRSAEQAALNNLSQYNQVKLTALCQDTSTNIHADDSNAWSASDIWYRARERSE